MSALPTGTVTFLFTDVEHSSAMWERDADAMRAAIEDHDAIMRSAVGAHNGSIFKTVGDSWCCAFANAHDALRAAVEAQRALSAHAWPRAIGVMRVRMGVHSGTAVERDGDYLGPAVNRVARLAGIAAGGQILASASTVALVRDTPPAGLRLMDLGAYRLRDLSVSETAYQVAADGIEVNFPSIASTETRPNNLPSSFSSFVGRQRELGDVRALLTTNRLVTVSGPGGIGKTRFALQLAAAMLGDFPHGVRFVDLVPIGDGALVARTVASALELREESGEPIGETLVRYLKERRILLVIDNAEHVLSGAAGLIKEVLLRCPGVTAFVTSREPLHLSGEHVYRLSSLPAPEDAVATDLERHEATKLFLERAREAVPGFVVTDRDAGAIARICNKLEGIPLAIELAAARVPALSVAQLEDRLAERLLLLASRDTTQGRHQTIRATIEWSYRLLEADEKKAFDSMAVFSGGCTLEACERVSGVSAGLDVVQTLVDRSLLQVESGSDPPRMRCLDLVREFATERLMESGRARLCRADHAAYYGTLASQARLTRGTDEIRWYRQFDVEIFNLRNSLAWCASEDSRLGARIVLDLASYFRIRGIITEARSWLRTFRNEPSVDRLERGALLNAAASFALMQDDLVESLANAQEALAIFRDAKNALGIAEALFRVAETEHRRGRLDAAQQLYLESQEHFRNAADARGETLCLSNLGMLARQHGDFETARDLLTRAMERAAANGERRIAGELAIAMGWVDLYLGDHALARGRFDEVLRQKRSDGDPYGECGALLGLTIAGLKQGRVAEAFECAVNAVSLANRFGLHDSVFRGLYGLSAAVAAQGKLELAARCMGLAERLFAESGRERRDTLAFGVATEKLATMDSVCRSALLEEGSRLTVDETITLARRTDAYSDY